MNDAWPRRRAKWGEARDVSGSAGRRRRRGARGALSALADLGRPGDRVARAPTRRLHPGLPSGPSGILGARSLRRRAGGAAALAGSRGNAHAVWLLPGGKGPITLRGDPPSTPATEQAP